MCQVKLVPNMRVYESFTGFADKACWYHLTMDYDGAGKTASEKSEKAEKVELFNNEKGEYELSGGTVSEPTDARSRNTGLRACKKKQINSPGGSYVEFHQERRFKWNTADKKHPESQVTTLLICIGAI